MVERKLLYRLYAVVWGALRVCASMLILMVALPAGWGGWQAEYWRMREAEKVDAVVCGKISGEVYEFSRLYFPFWPEYEGKSSFDTGFVNNNKGCDANLISIFLSMTWPGLEPADDNLIFRQGLEHEGLLVAVSPITPRDGFLRRQLDFLLRSSPKGLIALAEHDDLSRLNRVEGRDAVFEHHKKLIYWEGDLTRLSSVGYCKWRPALPNYYSCEMTYLVSDNILVKVTMRPDKLEQWQDIRRSVDEFLSTSKKTR